MAIQRLNLLLRGFFLTSVDVSPFKCSESRRSLAYLILRFTFPKSITLVLIYITLDVLMLNDLLVLILFLALPCLN